MAYDLQVIQTTYQLLMASLLMFAVLAFGQSCTSAQQQVSRSMLPLNCHRPDVRLSSVQAWMWDPSISGQPTLHG